MDIFSLRDSIVGEYRKFATSFTTIHADDIRAQVEAIYAQGRFWPDPLIQINPSYKRGANIETLIAGGALDPRTAEIFRADGAPLNLYKHQEQAIALASQGESYVVTTGTGSGKSLCFFIPIVQLGARREARQRYEAHAGHHHLPHERAGQQPARRASTNSSRTPPANARSLSLATPGRKIPRCGAASRRTRPISSSRTS